MKRASTLMLQGLVALLFISGAVACDALEVFDRDKEVAGTVEAIATDGSSITIDGIDYRITSDTEYEGFGGLDEIAVGDEVEIEYKENGGTRTAIEIERAGAEDEGADDDD